VDVDTYDRGIIPAETAARMEEKAAILKQLLQNEGGNARY
jgi:hypothetical protein